MNQASSEHLAPRVLFADDDPRVRRVFERTVRNSGFQVDLAVDGDDALSRAEQRSYAIIALDYEMPGPHSEALIAQLRRLQPHAALLVITGHPDYAMLATRMSGVFMVVSKPWEPDTLLTVLAAAARIVGEPVLQRSRGA